MSDTITIRIKNAESHIVEDLPFQVSKFIGDNLKYMPSFAVFTEAFQASKHYRNKKTGIVQKRKWDGKISLWNYKKRTFPTGLTARVRHALNECGYSVKIEDRRLGPDEPNIRNWSFKSKRTDGKVIEPRYYQKEAIEAVRKQQRGIIAHATGTGKTVTFTQIIVDLNYAPVIVFVPTRDLLYQTQRELQEMIVDENGNNVEVGLIGDGNVNIKDITVCVINSALYAYGMRYDNGKNKVVEDKRKRVRKDEKKEKDTIVNRGAEVRELIENCIVMIGDEVHRAATCLWKVPLKKAAKAKYRIGASATPYREDGCEMEIESLFGRIIHYYPIEKAIGEGFLMNPDVYLVKAPYNPDGAYIKKQRDLSKRMAEKGVWKDAEDWDYRETFNELVVFNEDLNQRIAAIAHTFSQKNMSVLILVKEYPQGELITQYLEDLENPDTIFLKGKDTSKKRNEAIQAIREKQMLILTATTLADMGLDLPSLDVLIMASGGGSDPTMNPDVEKTPIAMGAWHDEDSDAGDDRRFGGVIEQRLGRVVRKYEGKKYAIIIDWWHSNGKMRKQSSARRKVYRKRNLNQKILDYEDIPFDAYEGY